MKKIITLIGLPGSGKTTLGDMIHKLIGGARVNADVVRQTISSDLKFSELDREIQAYRMGAMAALSLYEPMTLVTGKEGVPAGHLNQTVIVDFVCPTQRTRDVYEWACRCGMHDPVRRMTIWMDTITPEESRFPDTAKLFEAPSGCDIIIKGFKTRDQLISAAGGIASEMRPDIADAPDFLTKLKALQ